MSHSRSKKTVLVVVVVALAALLAIGTTLAFLTDKATTTNVLNLGKDKSGKKVVDIELNEEKYVKQIQDAITANGATAGELVDSDSDGHYESAKLFNILPNQKINKDPVVKNIGAEDVYIRIRVLDTANTDAFANALLTALPTAAVNPGLGLAIDNTKWVKVGDYYYYSTAGATGTGNKLATGGTVDVFKYTDATAKTSMTVPEKWDYDTIPNAALDLKVEVQAIQARDFTPNLASANPWAYSDATPVAFAF